MALHRLHLICESFPGEAVCLSSSENYTHVAIGLMHNDVTSVDARKEFWTQLVATTN